MGYPDYPNNRMIVNGVDLSSTFKLILSDGSKSNPPVAKTYTVDIPGGNGKLDLTESLIGDSVYNNRAQEFTFYVVDDENFEKTKTDVSNFLHGREFDYQLTYDPGYTYHGRFSVAETMHKSFASGILGSIAIKVDAKPFKYKTPVSLSLSAVSGNTVELSSGRMRVCPTIRTNGWLKVIYNNKLVRLQRGVWKLNDLLLTQGTNSVYFNNYDSKSLVWNDLLTDSVTWGTFKASPLYIWYRSKGIGNYTARTWADIPSGTTFGDLADEPWYRQMYVYTPGTNFPENITVQYEWGDL